MICTDTGRACLVRGRPIPGQAFTLIELVVVLAIIGILMGLLLPALGRVRESANRAACGNNLKQIGLALIHYHDNQHSLPPGMSVKRGPVPPYAGWLTRLLPFVEQEALYQDAVASAAAPLPITGPLSDGPHVGMRTVVSVFGCLSDTRALSVYDHNGLEVACTSYIGVQGKNRARQNGV